MNNEIMTIGASQGADDYESAMNKGLIFPTDAVERACENMDMAELSRLLGPVLLATTAKSANYHLRSDSVEERKLGTAQVKVVMPFIVPKLEQTEIKVGTVAPSITEYIANLKLINSPN